MSLTGNLTANEEEVKRLLLANTPLATIAHQFNVKRRLVTVWARYHGIKVSDVQPPHVLDVNREKVEELVRAGNLSASQIAAQFGVTRSNLIGWAWRRKVKLRENPGNVHREPPKPKKPKRATSLGGWVVGLPSVVPNANMPEDLQKLTGPKFPQPWEGVGVPFTDGAGYCQRPLWGPEVSTGNVCGNKVEGRSRYCPSCHRVMWTTPPKKPRKNGPLTNTRYQSYKHIDFA